MRVAYSDHLVTLVAETAAASARVATAPAAAVEALCADARREAARLSARLDGSPLTDETADAVDAGTWDGAPEIFDASWTTGWAAALRLDGMATQDVGAIEYANVLACDDAAAPMVELFVDDPLEALAAMHRILCRGLVDPDVAGRARRTVQAVHDGAQGRVIFNTPDPETIPGLLEGLRTWLAAASGVRGGGGAAMPGVIVAAVVHERLLQWQPFEAANGRLARMAGRTVLRARGIDPAGVGVTERALAADPGGYYTEVAATIRRRDDLTEWAERHTEAVLAGLAAAADAVNPLSPPALSPRAAGVVDELAPGTTVTVAEYARRTGTTAARALADLRALTAAGAFVRQPRTRGMRFLRI